jgi:crossover junction endodeoxyribonuclease RuvC
MSGVIGGDIGAGGAFVLPTLEGDLDQVADIPILHDRPKGRANVNAPLLADILAKWHARSAFIEYAGARPGEGAVGAFAFGRSRGVVEGVLGALCVPVKFLTAPSWKRAIGLPAGKEGAKEAARAEDIQRWPDRASLFARVKDDGRADAALIGMAGLMREGLQ